MAYLCFQGEPLGFDEKDSIQEKNRGQMKPRKSQRKDAKGRITVQGSRTTMLQWPKSSMGTRSPRTAVRVTMRQRTVGRASLHGRVSVGRLGM